MAADIAPRTVFRDVLNSQTGEWEEEIYFEHLKEFTSKAFTPTISGDQLSSPLMIYVRQLIEILPEEEEPDAHIKELFDAIELNSTGKKVPLDQLKAIIAARKDAVEKYGDSLRMAVAFGYSDETVSPEKVESLKKICDIWIAVDLEVLNIAGEAGIDGLSVETATALIERGKTSLTKKYINADRMKGYLDKMYHVNEALRVGYIFKDAQGVVQNLDMKITGTEAAANFYSELLELYTSTDVPSASSTYENDSKKRKHSGLGKMIADIGALSIDDPRSMKLFEHAIKTNNAELVTQLASQFTNQQF
jgi:TPR repeat protein